jgi:hypothetical protein
VFAEYTSWVTKINHVLTLNFRFNDKGSIQGESATPMSKENDAGFSTYYYFVLGRLPLLRT